MDFEVDYLGGNSLDVSTDWGAGFGYTTFNAK